MADCPATGLDFKIFCFIGSIVRVKIHASAPDSNMNFKKNLKFFLKLPDSRYSRYYVLSVYSVHCSAEIQQ